MSQATTFFQFLLAQPVGIASNVLKMLNFLMLFSWYSAHLKREKETWRKDSLSLLIDWYFHPPKLSLDSTFSQK